jgi:hypothetical protein
MRKAFTFYSSYYESIKELPKENRDELYNGIIEYSFEKKEQNFTGISLSMWLLIKPNIDNNISRYENGLSPKNKDKSSKTKQDKSKKEAKKKQSKSNALSLSLIINSIFYKDNKELNTIFIEFLKLRDTLKAVNSELAIKELMNTLSKYDDDTKILMIKKSIKSSWKDVYPLKDKPYQKEVVEEKVPEWFGKEIKEKKASADEELEMKAMLEEFK